MDVEFPLVGYYMLFGVTCFWLFIGFCVFKILQFYGVI